MTTEVAGPTRASELLRRPLVAALVVLAFYGVLALLNSTGGYLGTDTGAKVITLDQMAEDDTFSPAIGYWAEEWDPDGDYHPLFDTRQNDDGEWVNVTTLPMLMAARPLYELGGYRLALLLPMLGGVLAAFACRDIARRLAGEREGWWAFWVVALASPVTIYALDLWEHSVGAGLMLTAIALLLRALRGGRWWLLAPAAGVLFGVSATMRAESLVVAFVAVGATCATMLFRRAVGASLLTGVLAVAGFAAPWLLNAAFEVEVGGNSRTARVRGEARREWWTELAERGEEALITWFALPNLRFPASVALGAVVVACTIGAVVSYRGHRADRGRLLVVLAVVILATSFSGGLGFISGALVASPLAGLAVLFARRSPEHQLVVASAIAMTVLIWLFQITGGAGPQWGGRYILVPTLLLTTVGIAGLAAGRPDEIRLVAAALAVLVTGFGALWLNHRSHHVDEYFGRLAQQQEDVVIFANGFLVREAGPAYADRRYLSLGRQGTLGGAVEVVRESGGQSFAIVSDRQQPPSLGSRHLGTEDADLLGEQFWYHRYEVTGAGPATPGT